jgi:hypothetical protein
LSFLSTPYMLLWVVSLFIYASLLMSKKKKSWIFHCKWKFILGFHYFQNFIYNRKQSNAQCSKIWWYKKLTFRPFGDYVSLWSSFNKISKNYMKVIFICFWGNLIWCIQMVFEVIYLQNTFVDNGKWGNPNIASSFPGTNSSLSSRHVNTYCTRAHTWKAST